MDFRICLLLVVVSIFRGCLTDFIFVDLPSSTYPTLTYRLDIDPIDRNYVCFNTNDNNTNTTWNDENLNNVHLLDIYSFYETEKRIGIEVFECYSIADEYLGAMMVRIQEGGHITVIEDNIPTNYSSNQVVEVSEYSKNVSITCSAHTGALFRDGVMQTFPRVTIATITPQDNNDVYKCERIIGGQVLFEVSITLKVLLAPTTTMMSTTTPTTITTTQTTTPTTPTTTTTTTPTTTTPTTTTTTPPTTTTKTPFV
eukprot:TRINITY_DN84_c1_g1_i5.p1 TRINITY_DN84_c1_g1~~TRINITY_DN84_c1_g1_i5.p1  ORF type:complete len:255 (+),score=70.98 TRINITY_DN84_c1_g1_i5:194-958(+)